MATLKENLIKEIQEIDDDKVLESIQALIHRVKDATDYIHVNDEQKAAIQEARSEYKKENFHSDELFDNMTTLTIDIPEKETKAIIAILKKHGVKVQESSTANLDKLEAEDYRKHFIKQADIGKGFIKKHL